MNKEEFEILTGELVKRIQDNLKCKEDKDYATDEDRLFNFHAAAPVLGSAEKACLAYATKHFMSIAKLVGDGGDVPRELALEKLGDMATYMVLMYAIMMEHSPDGQLYIYATID